MTAKMAQMTSEEELRISTTTSQHQKTPSSLPIRPDSGTTSRHMSFVWEKFQTH